MAKGKHKRDPAAKLNGPAADGELGTPAPSQSAASSLLAAKHDALSNPYAQFWGQLDEKLRRNMLTCTLSSALTDHQLCSHCAALVESGGRESLNVELYFARQEAAAAQTGPMFLTLPLESLHYLALTRQAEVEGRLELLAELADAKARSAAQAPAAAAAAGSDGKAAAEGSAETAAMAPKVDVSPMITISAEEDGVISGSTVAAHGQSASTAGSGSGHVILRYEGPVDNSVFDFVGPLDHAGLLGSLARTAAAAASSNAGLPDHFSPPPPVLPPPKAQEGANDASSGDASGNSDVTSQEVKDKAAARAAAVAAELTSLPRSWRVQPPPSCWNCSSSVRLRFVDTTTFPRRARTFTLLLQKSSSLATVAADLLAEIPLEQDEALTFSLCGRDVPIDEATVTVEKSGLKDWDLLVIGRKKKRATQVRQEEAVTSSPAAALEAVLAVADAEASSSSSSSSSSSPVTSPASSPPAKGSRWDFVRCESQHLLTEAVYAALYGESPLRALMRGKGRTYPAGGIANPRELMLETVPQALLASQSSGRSGKGANSTSDVNDVGGFNYGLNVKAHRYFYANPLPLPAPGTAATPAAPAAATETGTAAKDDATTTDSTGVLAESAHSTEAARDHLNASSLPTPLFAAAAAAPAYATNSATAPLFYPSFPSSEEDLKRMVTLLAHRSRTALQAAQDALIEHHNAVQVAAGSNMSSSQLAALLDPVSQQTNRQQGWQLLVALMTSALYNRIIANYAEDIRARAAEARLIAELEAEAEGKNGGGKVRGKMALGFRFSFR